MPVSRMPLAILSSVPSDSHTWNLVFLQLFIEERGFRVHNLGACTPFESVVEACSAQEPALLVVSSVNGHGAIEAGELGQRLSAVATRTAFTAVVGGKLWTDGVVSPERCRGLVEAGFDAVFADAPGQLESFIATLEACHVAATERMPPQRAAGA